MTTRYYRHWRSLVAFAFIALAVAMFFVQAGVRTESSLTLFAPVFGWVIGAVYLTVLLVALHYDDLDPSSDGGIVQAVSTLAALGLIAASWWIGSVLGWHRVESVPAPGSTGGEFVAVDFQQWGLAGYPRLTHTPSDSEGLLWTHYTFVGEQGGGMWDPPRLVPPATAPEVHRRRPELVRHEQTGRTYLLSDYYHVLGVVGADGASLSEDEIEHLDPFALLGDSTPGRDDDLRQLFARTGPSFDGQSYTPWNPSDRALQAALGSSNPWVAAAAGKLIRQGGPALYPEATRVLNGTR